MVKKSPQLQVVGRSAKVEPYDIVSLEQLSESERERIETALAEIEEGAGVLGVMRGVRPWDLRPVVMIFGESGPSLLRLVGPEVAHAKSITDALKAHFKRQQTVAANVFEWGIYQEQLWYRRPLFDRTLDAVLDSKLLPSVRDAFLVAEQLINLVTDWHRGGVVHGHICPANIALSMDNQASLFDAAVGYAIVRATRELGFEDFPQGYQRETFAPEILARGNISYSTDVFGLGIVFEKLFTRVLAEATAESWDEITETDVQAVIEFSRSMQLPELHSRPQLSLVQQFIANRGRPAPVEGAQQLAAKREEAVTERHRTTAAGEQESVAGLDQTAPVTSSVRERVVTESISAQQLVAAQKANTAPILPGQRQATQRAARQQDVTKATATIVNTPQASEQVTPHLPRGLDADPQHFNDSLDQDRLRPTPDTNFAKPIPKLRLPNWAFAVVALVLLLGVFAVNGAFQEERQEVTLLTDNDLVSAWNSSLPSRMSLVAQAAIHPAFPNEQARNLMLKSAMNAEELPGFNAALLRVAFSPEWEVDLSDADRRLAYALSAAELLHKDLPTDLPKLSELHPGLIFAVTATGGKQVASLLTHIPAARLTELPSPYRQAFKVLIKESPAATCGSPEVMELARFAAYGARDAAKLIAFLEADTRDFSRIRSLSYLLSQDPVRARELLNVLVGNPNAAQAVNHELINWGKHWQLYNWSELEATDQLLLLAGVPIQTPISGQNVYKLLLHPVVAVRTIGLERLLAQGRFPHPAGQTALSWAKENAELLSPKQTLMLSQIIYQFQTAKVTAIKEWLTSNPPKELVQILLVGTANAKEEYAIDFEFLQWLKNVGWTPNAKELKLLVKHPHRAVRLFIYGKLFSEVDKDTAIVLLLEARKFETIPEFLEQVERNIAVLSKQ